MKEPKIFLILKILAPIMMILGIVLIVLGTAVFPEMFNGYAVAPNAAYFAPGMIILVLSIPCFFFAFLPNIDKTAIKTTRYIQEENKEDLERVVNNSAEIIDGALTKTAKSIKQALKDTKYCKYCGTEIDADSKFCSKCGKEL